MARRKQAKALPPARGAALDALRMAARPSSGIQAALDSVLGSMRSKSALDSRDAALATELAYGLLRNLERVRFAVRSLLKNPDKLPAPFLSVVDLADLTCSTAQSTEA